MLRNALALLCLVFGLLIFAGQMAMLIQGMGGSMFATMSRVDLTIYALSFLFCLVAWGFAGLLWKSRSEMPVWGVTLLFSLMMVFFVFIMVQVIQQWGGTPSEVLIHYTDTSMPHEYVGWTLVVVGSGADSILWYEIHDYCVLSAFLLVPVGFVLGWVETIRLHLARRARLHRPAITSA